MSGNGITDSKFPVGGITPQPHVGGTNMNMSAYNSPQIGGKKRRSSKMLKKQIGCSKNMYKGGNITTSLMHENFGGKKRKCKSSRRKSRKSKK
jgi:hypothetical protein